MATSIGSLVVHLGLDAASYITGLDKSDRKAKEFARSIDSGLRAAGTAFIGLGVAAGAAAAVMVKSFIDAADKLNDLRRSSGLTGQELLILQAAAVRSGVGIDEIGKVLSKFTKQLGGIDEDSSKAAAALRVLGISTDDGSGGFKRQIDLLTEIGRKFREYEDGTEKAIAAQAILGKGGERLIPFIESLDEARERLERLGVTIEEDVITAADEFNDSLEDLKALQFALSGEMAKALLPHLQSAVNLFIELANNGDLVRSILDSVFTVVKVIAAGFIGLTTAVAIAAEAVFLLNKAFLFLIGQGGSITTIYDEIKISISDIGQRAETAGKFINKMFEDPAEKQTNLTPPKDREEKKRFPRIPDPSKLKAGIEAERKFQDLLTKIELDAVRDRVKRSEDLLQAARQDGLIGEQEYFQRRRELQQEQYSEELDALDSQIRRLSDIANAESKRGLKSKEYLNALGDLKTAEAARLKLTLDNVHAQQLLTIEQERSTAKYKRDLQEINIQLDEMEGNLVAAARARFKIQNEDFTKQAKERAAKGDTAGLEAINRLEANNTALATQNQLNAEANEIQTRLQIQQDRIQRANLSEIGRLNAVSDANARAAEAMRFVVMQKEQLARDNPGLRNLALDAEIARNELEKLQEQTNLVAKKLEQEFSDAASKAFEDWISGTKTAKEAFTDFANSVTRAINKMVAESLTHDLMTLLGLKGGTGESGGGIFKAIAGGLFGSSGGLAANFSGPVNVVAPAGSSILSDLALTGTGIGGFATGIDFVPQDMIAKIHRGERVVNAQENRRGWRESLTISNYFSIDGPINQRTQMQVEARAMQGAQRALDRIT